ncbi:MAG: MFS transporter [Clostridia bacterium]|nr:MFS transporter [Clostridia bacterium]
MSDEPQKLSREEALQYVHQDRRYVGSKETAAYIMYDASQSLHINKYEERFRWDVIKIDFRLIAIQTSIGGVWDIINDTIIATIVEKTRTRWGKFRPYMLFLQIPLTILGLWKWLLPAIFPGTSATYLPKWIVYFAMSVIEETANTFKGIAATGLMGTITPHPVERSRLIAKAQLVSSLFENAPVLIFGLLYDLTINNKTGWSLYHLFAGFGIPLALISSGMAFFFFIVSRERVAQSIEKPSVLMGLKAIINNKPMLIIVLSEFLGKFSIGTGMSNYFIDVLGASSYQTLVGIPASPVSYISYSFVAPLRRKVSTKAIWLFSDLWVDFWWLVVFGVGCINKNYQNKLVMLPLLAVQEVFRMLVYGPSHVITEELRNEAMDYCEWKNGYRAEAMTGVAKELVTKLMNTAQSTVNNLVMQKIGYIQGNIGNQAEKTKWWIFALATGIPIFTGIIGNVPKFFYPLNQKKRDQMYAELLLRRKAMAGRVSNASAEELAQIGDAERAGEYLKSLDELEK